MCDCPRVPTLPHLAHVPIGSIVILLLQQWQVMIAIHEYDSDNQFLCTVLTLNSLEALNVDVWRAADLGIPCCGGTSSASVSSTETFEVATCILLTRPQWPQWSFSCTPFDELPTRRIKVSKVELNRWLLQLQLMASWSTTDRPMYEHKS